MYIYELKNLTFHEAIEKLSEEKEQITTYEQLKEFAIHHIKEDNIYLAVHILNAIHEHYAEYYDYDYNMGTLENPTPLKEIKDLQDYCEFPDEDKTYPIRAHINSLNGQMDMATVIDERNDGNQTIYIVDYKGVKCTAIFNPFVCEYYVDDKYGILKEN